MCSRCDLGGELMSKANSKKYLQKTLIVVVIIFFIMVGSGMGIVAAYLRDTPEFDPSRLEAAETSLVFDDKNQVVAKLHAVQNRINVKLEEIPESN